MLKLSSSLLLFPLLALGIYLGSLSLLNVRLLLILFVSLTSLWLFLAYRGKAAGPWFFGMAVTFGALLVGQMATAPERAWITPVQGTFTGEVYTINPLSYDQRVLVRLDDTKLKVAVHLPLDAQVQIDDSLLFTGTVTRPKQAANPGVFCYRQYLRRLGVFGVCYPDEFELSSRAGPRLLPSIRSSLRDNVVQSVRDPGLVLALVLGERDQLGRDRQECWRSLGISHLLAISGMHVGLVALGVGLLAGRLPLSPWKRRFMVQGVLLAYVVVAGSGASAWRALLVSALGGYAASMGLHQEPLHLWATVGWILLLVKPSLIFDTGFLLSFAASGGILLWSPILRWRCSSRICQYIVRSLLISVTAQLSLAPLLFRLFGEVAVLGPLATLIFLPCIVILLVGGFLAALGLGPLGIGFLLNGVMNLVGALEALLLPCARTWVLGAWTLTEVCLWWILFVYAGWSLRKPRLTPPKRTLARLMSLAVVVFFIQAQSPVLRRPLEVTAVNVGQGDCYYMRTPSGVHLLIDGGGDTPYWQQLGRNVGEERLVPYLRYRQVPRIDYLILSHPHEDHLFGLLSVLEHFEVGMVIDNGHEHSSPSYQRYIELITEKGIFHHVARSGDEFRLGDGITLHVLYPDRVRSTLPSAYNNNSLLLRLQYGGIRLLFTGDLETAVLYDLVQDPHLDLGAQWLKVPHHGSRGSFLDQFYQAVNPSWAVISADPNVHGHPNKEVLGFLDEYGIDWRTTREGPVTFQIWWGLLGRFTLSPS